MGEIVHHTASQDSLTPSSFLLQILLLIAIKTPPPILFSLSLRYTMKSLLKTSLELISFVSQLSVPITTFASELRTTASKSAFLPLILLQFITSTIKLESPVFLPVLVIQLSTFTSRLKNTLN